MENVESLVNKSAEIHEFASEVARMITGAQMPEFSSESMSVADASKLIGLPATAIRAGIVYRWLPIGMAIHNNKPAKSLSEGRITYIISPRKVWEVTGHVWKGKEERNNERYNRFHPDRKSCELPAVLDMGQQSRSDRRSNRTEWSDIRFQTVAYMEKDGRMR